MNENFHRLVFNAVRGMLVAVQESAVGCGKGRHAGTRAAGGARVFVPVLWFTALVAAMMGLPPAPDARAQTLPIQVDKGALGARPYVNTAANGTPVVNIAAPNRPGGTSVNNFTQYNVGPSGVVINNSGQNSQTRIAGWVQGNMQLGNSHAGTIVQQVTAPNPSQLLGMQEIAGNRASLVIVNPAGITCSGCGTINADRFTLSTGRALYGPDGSLSGFDVSQGNIAIGAQGLSSPQAQVDLMARSIQVNGEIWSEYLAAIAGANQIDHQTLGATAQAGTGPAPQFALDASALGSMYAGAIRLVGTEKGVGFNLGNNIAASTGDIVVDANGDVRILQTARLQAQGAGVLAGANIDNAGAVTTRGGIQATAAGALTNGGLLSAGGNLQAQANRITNTGTIGVGTDAGGNVTQAGAADIAARTGIQSSGSILTGGDANLSAPNLNLNGGTLVSHGTANLSASGDIDLQAARVEGNAVQVAAGGLLDNRQGTIAAGANGGTMQAVSILNRGGSISSGGALAVTAQSLDNTSGTVAGTHATTIRAASTVNRDGVIGSTQGSLSVVGGAVQNDLGQLSAGGNLTVDTAGQALSNRQGVLAGNGDVAIDADALDNDAGTISAYKAMTITGARVDNTKGAIVSGGHLVLSADALANTGGQLASKGDATLRVSNTLNNTAGFIHASGTLDAQAATILNANTQGGSDSKPLGMEGGTVKVTANAIDNTDGALRADTTLTATAATLDNTLGEVTSGGTAQIDVGATTNTDGLLAANQKLGVTGTSLTGDGTIQSQGDVSVGLQSDFRNTKVMAAGRNLRVDTSGDIANDGTMSAGKDLDVHARGIGNTGELYGRESNRLRADQSIYNAGLIDGGAVRIDAGTTVTNVHRIFGDTVSIGAGQRIVNDRNAATGQGGVIASRSGDVNLGAPDIVNREQALIFSSRDLNVGRALDENGAATGRADTLINASATIDVARDANINAALVTNRNDHFSTERVDTGTVEEFYYRLNGSSEKIDPATTMIFLPTTTGTGLGKTASGGGDLEYLGADDYKRLVLPSTQYPFSEFGPPFDWSRQVDGAPGQVTSRNSTTWPVGKAYYVPQYSCAVYGNCDVDVPTYVYGPGDAIWGKLGVAPPDSAPPPIPACWNRPADCTPADDAQIAAFRAWEDANRDRYAELDRNIVAFNNDFQSRLVASWNIERRETRVQDEIVKTSDPARILVGGNASFGGAVVNDKSQILVGGTLTVPAPVQNLAYDATRFEDTSGSTQYTRPCKLSRCYDTMVAPTVHVEIPTRLAEGETLHNVGAIGRTGSAPDAASGPGPVAAVPTLRELTLAGKGDGRLGDATIRQVTPTLAMPRNALFRVNAAPGAHYLIETDPRFTNQRKWLSSDFMLTQLGRDPNNVLKRLGDGFYEARLVADAVMLGTGQRFVGDYADNEAQYIGLMKAGVTFAQQFNLTIGTELTAEQMKQLTSDMVWLVEKTVTLPDGTTQQVLVPQVYLMSHVGELKGDGTLMAANTVGIQTTGDVTNTGTISGRKLALIDARNITNNGGTLNGGKLVLNAAQDINNVAGTIRAGTLAASAGRDINLTTTTASGSASDAKGTASRTVIAGVSRIDVGDGALVAGRDINATAASIRATGSLALGADRDVNLNTVRLSESQSASKDAKNNSATSRSSDIGTQIATGKDTTILAARDVNATAAYVNAEGKLGVGAGRDLNIKAGEASASARDEHAYRESGFLSSKSTHTIDASARTNAVGSTFSGDAVAMQAGRDMTIAGSTVAGTNDVDLSAARNLTITTTETQASAHTFKEEKKSGFGATGSGLSYGNRNQKDTTNDNSVTQVGSLVGSTDGSVRLNAGSTLTVKGSDLIAKQNIAGVGADVNIEAAQNRQHRDETHEVKQSGFTLGVGGTVGQVMGAAQKVNNASKSQDGRAAALWGIAAARDAYDGVNAIGDLMGGGGAGDKKPSANIQLSWGSSQSKQTLTEDSTSHSGSRVQAGGIAAFVATGIDADGNKTAGDLNVIGSSINAQKVALQAKHDVNMVSATDTDESRSTNKSSGFTVGVSVGTDGYGVSASVSKAKGNSDSAGTSQLNSQVRGSESVTIVSGNDTNLLGGTVAGGKVSLDAGGNLNLASRQDTNVMRADQQSMSAGASFSTMGGGGASASFMKGKASGNYANVAEQSGIYAGAGGFDINVKGNTDLKGAVIASDAGKDRNKLSTGTLTFSDVRNHSDYSATSFGATVGTSPTAMSPMIPQRKSGSQSGAAQSAVAEGTIEIKDQSNQVQDVAALRRDTADTNKQVGTNPDLKNLLDKQADTMAAAQAAGAAIARTVGDYATAKQKDAEKQLKIAEGNFKADPSPENQAAIDAARADVAGWKEGGAYRAELHMAGGALVAGLGGGGALAGAAAAGLTSFAAPTLNNLSNAVASGVKTGNDKVDAVLGNLVANAVATGIGAAAGGGSGAAVASTVDAFNRQLHQDERKWAKDKAKDFAQYYKDQTGKELTPEQAQNMLLANGYRLVDDMASKGPGGDKYAVAFISKNAGGMFVATAAERANPGPLGGPLTPEQKSMPANSPNPQLGMAAGAGLGLVALGAVAPVAATAWALGTAYDYAGDTVSFASGLSKDSPSVGKSFGVGGVTALFAPLGLTATQFGTGLGSKLFAGAYNAGLAGTAAFGTSSIFSPSQNPGLAGGIAGTGSVFGAVIGSTMPGPAGAAMNQLIQVMSGPAQTAIESHGKPKQ